MLPAKVSPESLKAAVTTALISLLGPIQAEHAASREWQDVETQAYPSPLKKEKKPKDKGSRHPGVGSSGIATVGSEVKGIPPSAGVEVEALPDGSVQGPRQEQVSVGTSVQDAMSGLDIKK